MGSFGNVVGAVVLSLLCRSIYIRWNRKMCSKSKEPCMMVSYAYFRTLYEKYQQRRIWHLLRTMSHQGSVEKYGFVFCDKEEEEHDFFLYDEDENIKRDLMEDGGDGRALSNPNHHHTWRKEPIVLYVIRDSDISSLNDPVLSLLHNMHIQMGIDALYIVDYLDFETMMSVYEYNCFYDPSYTENENRQRIRQVFTIFSCVQHMSDNHRTIPHHIVIMKESDCETFGCITTMDNLISTFIDSEEDVRCHLESMLMIKSHAIFAHIATYVNIYDNDDIVD